MDCSLPGSSVHEISQARILERLPFPSLWNLPDPGTQPVSLGLAGGHGMERDFLRTGLCSYGSQKVPRSVVNKLKK